jgi:SAM-dependent methyltransferase
LVPRLRAAGYDAVGVDPNAPEEPGYERCEFEQYRAPKPAGAVIASTSLHHVAGLDVVLDQIAAALAPGGVVAVVEMGWEWFDERTAQWCFAHLTEPATEEDAGWLHHQREDYLASGLSWDAHLASWAAEHGLHRADRIVRGLDVRFDRVGYAEGPMFFADLDGLSADQERAAIEAGRIRALGVYYLGRTIRTRVRRLSPRVWRERATAACGPRRG